MASKALALSPGVADLLRRRRRDLGLTLRSVERLASEMGSPIPYSTLARIEQGLLDPGVKRLQQLLRIYHVPIQTAGDLLDLEDIAGVAPRTANLQRLYRDAIAAWESGDIPAAMAGFIAFRLRAVDTDSPLREKATLAFAVAAGSLGKHAFAQFLLDDLLTHQVPDDLLLSLLVQSAKTWHCRGAHEAALAFLGQAESHLGPKAHRESAWVFHERATILLDRKRFAEAERSLAKATAAYRKARDLHGEGRALGAQVRLLFDQDQPAAALKAASAARFFCLRHKLHRLATLRQIDEGRAHAASGNPGKAVAVLEQALADSISRSDQRSRFFAHYFLWDAAGRAGDEPRAAAELDAAKYHVRFVDTVTPETVHIRSLIAPSAPSRDGSRTRRRSRDTEG